MEGRRRRPGRRRQDPDGRLDWNELWTSDDRKALAFYETMFCFTYEAMNMGPTIYYMLKAGGKSRAGLCQSVNPAAKSMWLPYVAVADCDAQRRR
jgi:predicted enzyme related to lactoylglutathione lyase